MNHQGHTANLYNLANIPMQPAINDYKFEHCHLFICNMDNGLDVKGLIFETISVLE